ncbi:MAG: hypothetical protein KA293_12715 [Bacteroidia bacterium]|nr:hypothetical protein [Bacteroidia bacterium]
MNERLHGWLVLIFSAAFFVLDGLIVLGISESRQVVVWANSLSLVSVVVGLHFLWRTGIYQHSPLSKLANFGFGLAILSQLLRLMHWPFADIGILLSFAVSLVVYLIHFYLKGRRTLGDILRMLVMVITCVMLPASFLHWISPVQAYWGVIGIIALAILEYLLNSQKSDATYTEYTQNSNPSQPADPKTAGSQDELKQRYPELFDEE